jgi:hypothetical protein
MREAMTLLARELITKSGMFEQVDREEYNLSPKVHFHADKKRLGLYLKMTVDTILWLLDSNFPIGIQLALPLRNALRNQPTFLDDLHQVDASMAETFDSYVENAYYRAFDETETFTVEANFGGGDIREVVLARDADGNPRPYNKDTDYLEYINARRRWSLFRTTSPDQEFYFSLAPGHTPIYSDDESLQNRLLGSTISWGAILQNFDLEYLHEFRRRHENKFQMLENAVNSFNDEEKKKLMSFWTAIPSLPNPSIRRLLLGIEYGQGDRYGNVIDGTLLFKASTCSYQLRIPNKVLTQAEFTELLRNVISTPQTYGDF